MDGFAQLVLQSYMDMREEGTITVTSVDKLPYTDDFEALYEAVVDSYPEKTRADVWHRIANWRKQGFAKSKPKTEAERKRLTFTQVKILRIIADHPRGLSRSKICEKHGGTMTLTATLGPQFIEDIEKVEERYNHATLMGLGYVEARQESPEELVLYTITNSGKRALKAFKSAN